LHIKSSGSHGNLSIVGLSINSSKFSKLNSARVRVSGKADLLPLIESILNLEGVLSRGSSGGNRPRSVEGSASSVASEVGNSSNGLSAGSYNLISIYRRVIREFVNSDQFDSNDNT
jgi:hypothetical protein